MEGRTRVLVLQHPDESGHALNTARLAVLGLRNAELHVERQFDAALWQVAGYRPCLLFPGQGAQVLIPPEAIGTVDNPRPARETTGKADSQPAIPVLLVVPDGTWRQARQLLAMHPELAALPRVTLPAGVTTRYRVRYAGDAGALSTVEAIAAALNALEAPRSFDALLAPFEALIAGQIAAMGPDCYRRHHVLREGNRAAKRKDEGER
ncbi:tRNA-uridine aminocarboxypropyltransferase [Bordetella tumulicola]